MKVVFTKTGGFAPMPTRCELDTDVLPAPAAKEVRELVERSGIMDLKGAEIKGAADLHYYTITIEDDKGRKKRIRFDQLSVPPQMKPLIGYLEARATRIVD